MNTGVISERTPEPPKLAISLEIPSTVTVSPILPCNKDKNDCWLATSIPSIEICVIVLPTYFFNSVSVKDVK